MHSIYYSAKTRIQLDLIISYDPFEFLFQLQCVLSLTHGNKALAYDLSFLHFFTYFLLGNWKKEGRKQCGADKNESKERLSCMFEQLNNGVQREYGFLFILPEQVPSSLFVWPFLDSPVPVALASADSFMAFPCWSVSLNPSRPSIRSIVIGINGTHDLAR